jgi:hypothetical protein
MLSVIGRKFANWLLQKQKFRTGKNRCVKQLRTPFSSYGEKSLWLVAG